jgi:hypothetical protein
MTSQSSEGRRPALSECKDSEADTRGHCNKDVTMRVRASAPRMSELACGKQDIAMCDETERAIDVIASVRVALGQGRRA